MDLLGSAGLGSVSAIARGNAFGRPCGIDGTAGHDRATAALLPKRLRCRARVGSAARYSADCAGFAGTEKRRSGGPAGSAYRIARCGKSDAGRTGAARLQFGTRERFHCLPPVASLCLAEERSRRFGACAPERQASRSGEGRGNGGTGSKRRRKAPRRDRARSSARASTDGNIAVGATSIRGRQRRRQGVCRCWMEWRTRFRGREPHGSERRRVYRSRYVCGLVVPPTPEHSPDAFLISTPTQDHN